jgi:hypothetical protein
MKCKIESESVTYKEIIRAQYDKIPESMFRLFSSKTRQEHGIKRLSKSCIEKTHEEVNEKMLEILDNQKIRLHE